MSKLDEFSLWLVEVKGSGRDRLGKREEKEMFAQFVEDYNTATLPHVKYYNVEKWERAEAAAGRLGHGAAGKGAMSDAEALRVEQQSRRHAEASEREAARVAVMKEQLRQAKDENRAVYTELVERKRVEAMTAPTFESIAKGREEEKKRKEMEAKRKFK